MPRRIEREIRNWTPRCASRRHPPDGDHFPGDHGVEKRMVEQLEELRRLKASLNLAADSEKAHTARVWRRQI